MKDFLSDLLGNKADLVIKRLKVVLRAGKDGNFLVVIGDWKVHFYKSGQPFKYLLTVAQELHYFLGDVFADNDIDAEVGGFFFEVFFDQFDGLVPDEVDANCVGLGFFVEGYFSEVIDALVQQVLNTHDLFQNMSPLLVGYQYRL